MNVYLEDLQAVGETEATLFESIQPAPADALVLLENIGTQDLKYRFDYWSGSAWVAMGADGSDYQNVVSRATGDNPVKAIKISLAYTKFRVRGNGWTGATAGGTTTLKFAITRNLTRASGGSIPVISV